MKMSKRLAAVLIGAVGAVGIVQASPDYDARQGTSARELPMSVGDLVDRRAERFSEADANGDRQLDVDEMATAISRMHAEHRTRRLDTDGDGVVRKDEFIGLARRRFEAMDRNGDGEIARREMRRGHERDDDHHEYDDDDRGHQYRR